MRSALEDSIKPLHEYVKTFAQFEHENQLNPDKYVKGLDEGDDPVDAEALRTDVVLPSKGCGNKIFSPGGALSTLMILISLFLTRANPLHL